MRGGGLSLFQGDGHKIRHGQTLFFCRLRSMKTPTNKEKPQTKTFEGDRIAKWLARAGIASRREAEKLIAEGRVCVNGKRSPARAERHDGRQDHGGWTTH